MPSKGIEPLFFLGGGTGSVTFKPKRHSEGAWPPQASEHPLDSSRHGRTHQDIAQIRVSMGFGIHGGSGNRTTVDAKA